MAHPRTNFLPFTTLQRLQDATLPIKRCARTPFPRAPFSMPPKRQPAVSCASDSEELSGDDDDLVWQDDINWQHYAPTRGLNPSLCVRTRILISMAATRLVTQQQRRDCWTAVGDFPLDRKRVLDAMGAEEPAPRKSSRHAIRSAAEEVRDLAFASDQSDGGLLRRVRKMQLKLCALPRLKPLVYLPE